MYLWSALFNGTNSALSDSVEVEGNVRVVRFVEEVCALMSRVISRLGLVCCVLSLTLSFVSVAASKKDAVETVKKAVKTPAASSGKSKTSSSTGSKSSSKTKASSSTPKTTTKPKPKTTATPKKDKSGDSKGTKKASSNEDEESESAPAAKRTKSKKDDTTAADGSNNAATQPTTAVKEGAPAVPLVQDSEQSAVVEAPVMDEADKLRAERLAKLDKLERVENFLRKKYKGWDNKIDEIMSIAALFELNPESISRPIVFPLIGLPGGGKTTFFEDFIREMGWAGKYTGVMINKGMASMPIEALEEAMVFKDTELPVSGPQAIVGFDEIQELASEAIIAKSQRKDVDEDEESEKKDKRDARDHSYDFLWEALGNGKVTGSIDNRSKSQIKNQLDTVKNALETIRTKVEEIETTKKRLLNPNAEEELMMKEAFGDEGEDIFGGLDLDAMEDEIKPKRKLTPKQLAEKKKEESARKAEAKKELIQQLRDAKYELESAVQEIVDAADWMRSEHKPVLGELSGLTATELAALAKAKPQVVADAMFDGAKKYNPSGAGILSRALIVIFGNPTPLIKKLQEDLGDGIDDPDRLHDAIKRINQGSELDKWVLGLFGDIGKKPGWASRINIEKWKIIETLTSTQWKDLIREQLDVRAQHYHNDLNKIKIPGKTIEFHPSVNEIIYRAAVDPQGARNLEPTMNTMMGAFLTKLSEAQTRSHIKGEAAPDKLIVAFDPTEKRLVAVTPDSAAARQIDENYLRTSASSAARPEPKAAEKRHEYTPEERNGAHQLRVDGEKLSQFLGANSPLAAKTLDVLAENPLLQAVPGLGLVNVKVDKTKPKSPETTASTAAQPADSNPGETHSSAAPANSPTAAAQPTEELVRERTVSVDLDTVTSFLGGPKSLFAKTALNWLGVPKDGPAVSILPGLNVKLTGKNSDGLPISVSEKVVTRPIVKPTAAELSPSGTSTNSNGVSSEVNTKPEVSNGGPTESVPPKPLGPSITEFFEFRSSAKAADMAQNPPEVEKSKEEPVVAGIGEIPADGLYFSKGISIPMRAAVKTNVASEGNAELERLAYHQAGRAVVGTLFFGSVPVRLARKQGSNIDGLWAEPTAATLHHNYHLVMTLLGGLAAEDIFVKGSYQSELAGSTERTIQEIMESIMHELEGRRSSQAFGGQKDKVSYKDVIPEDLQEHAFFKAIIQSESGDYFDSVEEASHSATGAVGEKTATSPEGQAQATPQIMQTHRSSHDSPSTAALQAGYQTAKRLLQNNRFWVKEIKTHLEQKPALSHEEMKEITRTAPPAISAGEYSALMTEKPGASAPKNCQASLVKASGGAKPGVIDSVTGYLGRKAVDLFTTPGQ